MGKLVIDEKTLLPKNLDDKTRTSIVKSMYDLDEADRAADESCGASEELHRLIEQEKVMGFGDIVLMSLLFMMLDKLSWGIYLKFNMIDKF